VYHSTALLLPDGRILSSGTGEGGGGPSELNAELFSPPYLFRGPRPTITTAPSLVGYGTSFSVTTPQAADIAKVSLIRLGSTTHAFDMNQRFQSLSFTRAGDALTIAAPTKRERTPPGHYMLFILDGNDVPSVAKIVTVGSSSEPSPMVLTVSGRVDATKQYMTLDWTGARGASVDVYRNGPFYINTLNDGHYVNSRNLPGSSSYTYKACEAGTSVCSNEATVTFGGGTPPPNAAPTASFTSSCPALGCTFTDGSTDGDGTVTAWSWDFGDGQTSTARNPSHTYATAQTYTVTLTVTDDDGATNQRSAQVTVTSGPSIVLTVSGRVDATKQYMTLDWTGANGATVDVYRNGPFYINTLNDGHYVNSRNLPGSNSYTYKVCAAGTSTCSNEANVVFK
jgi:PKD repeat protein